MTEQVEYIKDFFYYFVASLTCLILSPIVSLHNLLDNNLNLNSKSQAESSVKIFLREKDDSI